MKSGFLKLLNIEQVGLEDFDEEEEIELGQTEEQTPARTASLCQYPLTGLLWLLFET